MTYLNLSSKILITGGSGLIGTALKDKLLQLGYANVFALSSQDVDLTRYDDTIAYFKKIQPDLVFHLAAAVHGIMGNLQNKGSVFLKNILMNAHVIEASRLVGVKKIVAMGSVCAYPYPPPSLPLLEDNIWQGEPHPAENSYAHAKRAMLAQLIAYKEEYSMDFAFVLSSNLYGPNDKFDINFGHVLPSLIRKFYEAKKNGTDVSIWGDGSSARDFVYSEDAADALILIMQQTHGSVNLASGTVHSIAEVVNCLAEYTQMQDHVVWDASKPNGQGYRSYDMTRLNAAGFIPKFSLKEGIQKTFDWYAENADSARK